MFDYLVNTVFDFQIFHAKPWADFDIRWRRDLTTPLTKAAQELPLLSMLFITYFCPSFREGN